MTDTLVTPPAPAPEPAPTPAPAPEPSAVTPDPAPEPNPSPEPAPADDWRKSMAGDNEDALNLLGRYTTPQDAARALVEQRQLLSKRDEGMIKLPGENATDEERAAFAKAMGIPESPDKYERYKPEGEGAIELAEADKAFVDSARTMASGTLSTLAPSRILVPA